MTTRSGPCSRRTSSGSFGSTTGILAARTGQAALLNVFIWSRPNLLFEAFKPALRVNQRNRTGLGLGFYIAHEIDSSVNSPDEQAMSGNNRRVQLVDDSEDAAALRFC